jgi:hypothetical protein
MFMALSALSPFSPLAAVLNDIQRAIEAKLYYPALLTALTVPDICVALALSKDVMVRGKHYIAFVDRYTTPPTLGLDGQSCYRLRGGVVHRANMAGHAEFAATHVVFTVPDASGTLLHAFSIRDEATGKIATMFDLVSFCTTMTLAAKAWFEEHQDDPLVEENMKNLIRYCPNGLYPFVGGAPVVASGI